MTLNEFLGSLVSKYTYIKYVALLDEQARLMYSGGNWDDHIGLDVANSMLDSRDKLWNSLNEEIRQICVTTNQGYLYLIEFDCDSTYFFLAKTDNSQRVGVIENIVEGAVNRIKALLEEELTPITNPINPESNGTHYDQESIVNVPNSIPPQIARGKRIIE